MSLHLVDDDGHLQPEKKLTDYLAGLAASTVVPHGDAGSRDVDEKALLSAVGMNYHVVGVFGGQSSGKSTLLNNLFGTEFQMLDETVRRGQTTKGAFMAKADTSLPGFEDEDPAEAEAAGDLAAPSPERSSRLNRAAAGAAGSGETPPSKFPLLVVDFEGTDGLERGEDQSFERQLSLFGLSVADTLIINMWAVDVGRFNAANLTLLRTIFEVNLQLFSHDNYEAEEKPTLLIVLRDFIENDPAPSLATVRKSFDTIWHSITRPPQFEQASIDALFHLKYYVMPHYKLQKKEFAASVGTLRQWFGDSHCKDYLFSHRAMFRGVPLEGLPAYLASCWEAIKTSKDLDIPTQREMLAQHRCKEAKDQELRTFRLFTRHYEDRLQRGEMLLRLSEVLDKEMETRLTSFYKQIKLYHGDVVAQYAGELETELVDATMQVVNKFSKAIAAEVLANAEARVLGGVEESYRQLIKSAQALPFLSRDAAVEEAAEADAADGATAPEIAARWVGSQVMDSAGCEKLARGFWKTLCGHVNDLVSEVATLPPPAHLYGRYASLIAQDPTARLNVLNVVTDALFQKMKSRVSSMADSACDTMHGGFERSLTHNVDGTVRFFSTTKGLQKAVPAALQTGMVVLGSLIYFRLKLEAVRDDEDVEGSVGGAVAPPQSRSVRRVKNNRRAIVFDENQKEASFYLTYSTLDIPPKYPYDVPVVSADAESDAVGVLANCVMLSQQATLRAYELYKQKCDFTTQLQLRAVESGNQRIPTWVFPALLVLGWNELWYVLTSPILLVCLIVLCTVFFKQFFVAQWHAFEETGPANVVIPLQTVIRTVRHFVGPLLDDGTAADAAAAAAAMRREDETATEMRSVRPTATSAAHVNPTAETTVPTEPRTMRHRGNRKED